MLNPSSEQPTTLHIYNFGGVFSDRKIIKEDKTTPLYFVKNTRSSLHWTFDLHADGPDGPLLCRAQSSHNGPPLMGDKNHVPATLSMTAVKQTVKMEMKHGAVFFQGPDQQKYRWQRTARLFKVVMECLDAKGAIIATYRDTPMSVTKEGVLVVQPSVKFMLDWLVATSLAMRMPNN